MVNLDKNSRELLEAVQKINNELYKKYNKWDEQDLYTDWISRMPQLNFLHNSIMNAVSLSIPTTVNEDVEVPEILLYDDATTERIYYEQSDKYETYYSCIKRRFREYKEQINSVKL
ncbi:MAG: hypothetical protein ACOC22_02650 [bacterium]